MEIITVIYSEMAMATSEITGDYWWLTNQLRDGPGAVP